MAAQKRSNRKAVKKSGTSTSARSRAGLKAASSRARKPSAIARGRKSTSKRGSVQMKSA